MRHLVAAAGVAVILAMTATAQTAPQAELLREARAALQSGDHAKADALSSALLAADPKDFDALMIRAVAARSTGRVGVWESSASAAYHAAENDFQRFDAAMVAGQAAARQNKFTRAQLWLRRADQFAPDQAKGAVAQAYRQVAMQNPLSISLSFGVTPSNNVNNGSEETTIEIGGLPFSLGDDAQPLGGYEANASVSVSYRLSAGKKHRTDALIDLFGKKVWLDSNAKDLAPDVDGSDFDYGAVVVGLRHSRLIWPDLGPSQIVALLGQSWSGGPKQATWRELQFSQVAAQGEGRALRFGASLRDETRNGEPINDSQAAGLSVNWSRVNDGGGVFSLGASVKSTRSDSATVDNLAFGTSVGQSLPNWGAIKPRLTARLETRDYRKWATTPGGRRDDSLGLRLDIVWPEISYYGFAPQMTLNARRVWSNVDIYDRETLSLGLTAVSRF